MPDTLPARLPRGRHGLTRAEVQSSQRDRLLDAMAHAMSEQGYVATSVADVIKRAGVSRESFYELFSSKLDCFMSAFDIAGDLLLAHLAAEGADGVPLERFEHAIAAYLDVLVAEPAYARLFLVEVYAAGPEAMRRRADLQARLVDALAELLETDADSGRFTCQLIVSAVSAMVTVPLVANDMDELQALAPQLVDHVRRAWAAGLFQSS